MTGMVRFHGILDDDMSTSQGPGLNSFVNVDSIADFLVDRGSMSERNSPRKTPALMRLKPTLRSFFSSARAIAETYAPFSRLSHSSTVAPRLARTL